MAGTCRWCAPAGPVDATGDEPASVMVDEGTHRFVVPRRHVSLLTELPLEEMAAVLAAISAEAAALRALTGRQVEIEAEAGPAGSGEHLRVRLTPVAERARGASQPVGFASLVSALAD